MPSEKMPRSIGQDTGIVPDVVAESVVEKAFKLIHETPDEREIGYYAGRLVEQAETLYHINPTFRRKIRSRGDAGRDALYSYMQHWISSRLLQDSGNRSDWRRALVDSGFSMGR